MYVLTEKGLETARRFIQDLKAQRKTLLDLGLDTADETSLPTVEDIESDINLFGLDDSMEYFNFWAITDHCDSKDMLWLQFPRDISEAA